MSKSQSNKRKIICIETNEIFDSAKEIERKYNYANSNIIGCCKGHLITAYGFHWKYLENKDEEIKKDKRKRKVKCINTNVIYESASMASKECNVSRPNITKCCQGLIKSVNGLHWEYAE